MRTDVLLAKGGEVVTVNKHGDEGADKGYDAAWAMCESGGKEGWMPRRYLTALSRATCAECKNSFGPQNRARTCHECNRTVCSLCGESFLLKVSGAESQEVLYSGLIGMFVVAPRTRQSRFSLRSLCSSHGGRTRPRHGPRSRRLFEMTRSGPCA